jgi:hypothetical protein
MATKNLILNLRKPGIDGIGDVITFTTVANDNDYLRIPRRYPFTDIANYAALKSSGYFRHGTTTVSSKLGGSATTNTEGVLGFQLPNTEKLILLVKRNGVGTSGTAEEIFKIEGSLNYGIEDVTVTWAADAEFTSGSKIYEVDLFNFGLMIEGVSGEDGVSIKVVDKTLEFALIARMA